MATKQRNYHSNLGPTKCSSSTVPQKFARDKETGELLIVNGDVLDFAELANSSLSATGVYNVLRRFNYDAETASKLYGIHPDDQYSGIKSKNKEDLFDAARDLQQVATKNLKEAGASDENVQSLNVEGIKQDVIKKAAQPKPLTDNEKLAQSISAAIKEALGKDIKHE